MADAPAQLPLRAGPRLELGRAFVHPAFDVLIIGGGLSLLFTLYLRLADRGNAADMLGGQLGLLLLLSNSSHFAASTVRLYSKPGAFRDFRFLTMGLPLATIAVLTGALAVGAGAGRHLLALYFSWSPYHYAAQAYGLAMMYCYRAGGEWTDSRKRWIRLSCFLAFLYAFLNARSAGIEWLLPASVLDQPGVDSIRAHVLPWIGILSFALPMGLFLAFGLGKGPGMPLISLLAILANGVWWVALPFMDAFVWATIFHGLQYLAIVTIFHVRERLRLAPNSSPWWSHLAQFYLASLALGYLLFQVWPHFYVLAGFGFAESLLLVVAVINIHHFVVDAFIWRLRRDANYAVVRGAAPLAA